MNNLFHIHRENGDNPLYKWIALIEGVLDLFPGTMFLEYSRIVHLREVLGSLRWCTVRESTDFSGWKRIDMEKQVDDFESAVRGECTENICHFYDKILFLKHLFLYLFKFRHRVCRCDHFIIL